MWILGLKVLKDLLYGQKDNLVLQYVPTPEMPSNEMGLACHSRIQPYN